MPPKATIQYTAEIRDLRKQLASIPGITAAEARKAVKELDKTIRATEAVQTRAKKSLKGTSGAMKQLGMTAKMTAVQIPDVASQLAAGTPPAQIFAQQGLQVVQQAMTSLGAVAPTLAVGLAAVANAAVVGAVAYKAWNEEADRTARVGKIIRDGMEARIPIMDALRQSTIDLAVATGEMTAQAAKMDAVSVQAMKRYEQSTEGARKQLGELQEKQAGVFTQMVEFAEGYAPAWTPVGFAVRAVTSNTEELQVEIDQLNTEISTNIDLTEKQSETAREAVKVTDQRAAATRRLSEAEKEKRQLRSDLRKYEDELRTEAKKAREQEIAEELRQEEQAIKEVERMRKAAYLAERARAAKAAQEEQQRIDQTHSAYVGLTSNIASAFGDMETSKLKGATAAEKALWGVRFLAAQASIGAAGAEGYANASKLLPPANIIQYAAVTVGIAGAEAKLLSSAPSFGDTPGPVHVGPQGIRAAPGDLAVLGRTREDLARQINVDSQPVVIMTDSYESLGRFGTRDAMRSPGAWNSVNSSSRRIVGRR